MISYTDQNLDKSEVKRRKTNGLLKPIYGTHHINTCECQPPQHPIKWMGVSSSLTNVLWSFNEHNSFSSPRLLHILGERSTIQMTPPSPDKSFLILAITLSRIKTIGTKTG